jgi:hypothetical protein
MKRLSVYVSLLVILSLSAYAQVDRTLARALTEDYVREGATAVTPELYQGNFTAVLSAGATPLYEEALAIDGDVTDPEGNVSHASVNFVPFLNAATGKRGYYMRVRVSSLEGAPLAEHESIVHDDSCDCLAAESEVAGDSPPALKIAAQSFASDVAKVVKWIKAKEWASVNKWIAGQIAKGIARGVLAEILRVAFEKTGHRCPKLSKMLLPGKFYIYLATCYRTAY